MLGCCQNMIYGMKTIKLLLFFLVFVIFHVYCQDLTGEISYRFFVPQGNKSDKVEKYALLSFVKDGSLFEFAKNGFPNPEQQMTNDGNIVSIKESPTDEIGSYVWRNYSKQEIIFRQVGNRFLSNIYVTDNWKVLNWELKKGTKKIGKYECNKAVAKFRGREFTAWYALELPVPYGPWKLFGLPGLILEASDDTKEFYVVASEIKIGETKEGIILEAKKGEKDEVMDFLAYKDYEKNFKVEYAKRVNSTFPRGAKVSLKPEDIKTNRIELDLN